MLPAFELRRLNSSDASAYQAVRLAGLQEAPLAFASSYEEEKDFPTVLVETRLATKPDRSAFGAFANGELVGVVTLGREDRRKRVHKAFVWAMYVLPKARGRGVGRALLREALCFASSLPEIRTVSLSVTASNVAAIALYESMGFTAFGREPDALLVEGALHDEIHMSLPVSVTRDADAN